MEIPAIQTVKRPTLSLALIAKNEAKNINRLLDSVEGCFDEIVLVDTGSTDKTKEIAEARGCLVHDFKWVNSFCKARNFAFSKCTKDFIMWLDLDDVLHNKENFIQWRDHAMDLCDFWFASYHYALDAELKPIISFVRERVMRRKLNPTWQYDLHEGVIPKPEWKQCYITTWQVKHMRDQEDILQDRSRNITMIEQMAAEAPLDPRMQFYYGKELYEAGRASDAVPVFEKAITQDQQLHDKLLSIQYGGYSCLGCHDSLRDEMKDLKARYLEKCLDFALKGIRLEPNRAEFHILAADAYMRMGNIVNAIPYLNTAKACIKNFDSPYESPLYSHKNLYGETPSIHLARIYAHVGLLDKAKKEAEECYALYKSEDAKQVMTEVSKVSNLVRIDNHQTETDDIIFTCPPHQAYPFDEEIYKTKPLGGSETALVQMARLLKKKTGRNVIVFNSRDEDLVAESGVIYRSSKKLTEYVSRNTPRVHVAWRHNIKLTNAPTYLWCHDLFTPGVEVAQNFDKMLCLSPWHKNYIKGLQGVPDSKIIVTRNGIEPAKFQFPKVPKNPNKVVWLSSPDRGLDRTIKVLDIVRREFPDVTLDIYYGLENLHKYGPSMAALAEELKRMIAERPWITYHGFTEQNKMYRECADAAIWLHCCSFYETFCITALETLANGIFPITRYLGGLQDTLADAERNRQAIMIRNGDWDDEEYWHNEYAKAVCRVILNKQWENVSLDFNANSWDAISDEWIEFMGLSAAKTVEEVS